MQLNKTTRVAIPALAIASIALGSIVSANPIARVGAKPAIHRAGLTPKTVSTTELFAGGATLPAFAYEGLASQSANPVSTQSAGSVFNYYVTKLAPAGTKISYCQTGSGFGKRVLDGVNATGATDADLACAPLGTAPKTGSNGFAAAGQNVADFSGSDAPFSSSEYSAFATNGATGTTNPIAGRLEPVQVPVLAGSVAMFYHNIDTKVSGIANLPLDDQAICKMAAGQITTWGALETQLKNDNIIPSSTPAWVNKSLYFVSRFDGSGTSFSFTNHLAAVCGSFGITTFGVNQTFSMIIASGTQPATFTTGSGNPGVVNCVKSGTCLAYGTGTAQTLPASGDGAFGYVEAGNALKAQTSTAKFATVGSTATNQKSPIKDLPAAASTLSAANLIVNSVVNQNTSGGAPNPFTTAITPAVAGSNCLVVVDPAKYANPSAGYPIIAVTNLEFSYANNLGKNGLEQNLAKTFFSAANFGTNAINSVNVYNAATGTTGFSTLNLSGAAPITTAIGCIGA